MEAGAIVKLGSIVRVRLFDGKIVQGEVKAIIETRAGDRRGAVMRVRVNSLYTYNPVLLDVVDGRTNLKKGDMVRVVNLPGCPKANVMNHCHVADPETDRFIGLVCCNSLEPITPDDLALGDAILRVSRVSKRDTEKKLRSHARKSENETESW